MPMSWHTVERMSWHPTAPRRGSAVETVRPVRRTLQGISYDLDATSSQYKPPRCRMRRSIFGTPPGSG